MAEAARTADAAVGGGLVATALAPGFARGGATVAPFDADGFHASGGDFGLIWVQGKGAGTPADAGPSGHSADRWGAFAAELEDGTGVATDDQARTGGRKIARDDAAYERFATARRRLHDQPPEGADDARVVDAAAARAPVPALPARRLAVGCAPFATEWLARVAS
jgi:hypothetical protein